MKEELTFDVAKEMLAEYRYEVKQLKEERGNLQTRIEFLLSVRNDELAIHQEEVRKLVEVLRNLTYSFSNSMIAFDIQRKIDEAKEAIKPYIK